MTQKAERVVFVGKNTRNDCAPWMWTCLQIDGPNGEWGPWHFDKDDWGWADTFVEAARLGDEHVQLHITKQLNEAGSIFLDANT